MATKKLSPKELAALFLDYRDLYDQLQEKEALIVQQTLLQKDTQKVAGVIATYYKESQKVDYETAAREQRGTHPDFEMVVGEHTELKPSISWKSVCDDMTVPLDNYTVKTAPRVVVKVKVGSDD